jgi:hypothetical protein
VDLETLRIRIEATTGKSAKELLELNRLLSAQRKMLQASTEAARTNAAQSRASAAAQAAQAASARASAAQSRAATAAISTQTAQLRQQAAALRLSRMESDGLGKSLSTIMRAGQFLTAYAAVMKIYQGLKGVYHLAEEAARNNAARMYFEDAGKSIEKLRAASRGLVDDQTLMKKANLADSMGLSEDVFARLIGVAEAASAKTGQSFERMFDSIVLGTARSSRLLLDNLGVIVNIKEAQRDYAEQMIKSGQVKNKTIEQTVRALTEEGKKAAFLNKLYKATEGQMEQFNKLGLGGAAIFDKFAASMSNLKQALVTQVLPVISSLLEKLTRVSDYITDLMAVNMSGIKTVEEGSGLGTKKFYEFGGQRVAAARGALGFSEKSEVEIVAEFKSIAVSIATELARSGFGSQIQKMMRDGALPFVEGTNEAARAANRLIESFNVLNRRFRAIQPPAKQKAGDEPHVNPDGGGGGSALKGEEWIPESQVAKMYDPGTLTGKWADEAAKEQEKARRALEKENAARDKAVAAYKERVEKADQQYIEMQHEEVGLFKKFFEDLAEAAAKAAEKLDSAMAGVVNGVSSVAQGGGIGAAFGGMAGGALATAVGLPPQTGGAIGDMFGQLLDKLPGMVRITQAISDGFQKMMVIGLEPLMGILIDLAEPIYQLLLAFGVLTKSAMDPLLILFRILVPILAGVIRVVAGVLIALAPFLGIIQALTSTMGLLVYVLLVQFIGGLISLIPGMGEVGDWVRGFRSGIEWMTESMVEGAVNFHNGILGLIRMIPGMEEFGTMLQSSDFEWDDGSADEPTEDNTDAVNENTRALRDLAREFHNLPSGYKGNAAVYNASDRENPYWLGPMRGRMPGLSGDFGDIANRPAVRRFNPYRG